MQQSPYIPRNPSTKLLGRMIWLIGKERHGLANSGIAVGVLQHFGIERGLVVEVIVDRRHIGPRLIADIPHRASMETMLSKDGHRSIQNVLFGTHSL